MAKSNELRRIVIDTNILVSAIVYGGIPKQIVSLVVDEVIEGVISPVLRAEFLEVLSKKFSFSKHKLAQAEALLDESFTLVQPVDTLSVVSDDDDNRVIEAAVEGNCDSIVTGDNDLLRLKKYMHIVILTPKQFLERNLL